MSIIHLLINNQVILPKKASWLETFEQEFSFPNSKHDDQIDSMTQFCNYKL